jgi:hypothetical protein
MTETKRKPRELNDYEIAGRTVKVLAVLDEQIAYRRKVLKEAEADRKKIVDELSPAVRELLKLDAPKSVKSA